MATAIENIEHHIKYFKEQLDTAEKQNDIEEKVNSLRKISLAELCIAYIKEEDKEKRIKKLNKVIPGIAEIEELIKDSKDNIHLQNEEEKITENSWRMGMRTAKNKILIAHRKEEKKFNCPDCNTEMKDYIDQTEFIHDSPIICPKCGIRYTKEYMIEEG